MPQPVTIGNQCVRKLAKMTYRAGRSQASKLEFGRGESWWQWRLGRLAEGEKNVGRYWLHFDISTIYPRGWPPVIGVTGRDLNDCLDIIAHRYGPNPPPLTRVVDDPDLTDFRPGAAPGGWPLGVPVWRGIWYPPENLGGPEPPERQLSEPRWWHESR